jgi:predicted nucleic acid-binding protein
LGAGEVSTVVLAKELSADLVLIDERRARHYAQSQGIAILGCVGVLEDLYNEGHLNDLRGAYHQLVRHQARVDLRALEHSLAKCQLLPL